jgi:ketosteroid isomerase-like protein
METLFTEDAVTIEHPNLLNPKGGQYPLARMKEAAVAGAALMSKQTYALQSGLEHGNTAVLRVKWTGWVARARGPFREGQVLEAHLAQFITVRDGRIAVIETYDCYEPFA